MTPTYTTPTFVIKVLHLIACVQLLKKDVKSEGNSLYSESLVLLGWFL